MSTIETPESSNTAESLPTNYLYVATMIISDPDTKSKKIFMHFQSMAELINHLINNNLLIGTPQLHTPMVSVERVDGVALKSFELEELALGGINIKGYQERIVDVLGEMGYKKSIPSLLLDPYYGVLHAAVGKSLNERERNEKKN